MPRPRFVDPDGDTQRVTVLLPRTTVAEMRLEAERTGRTMSAVMRDRLERTTPVVAQ